MEKTLNQEQKESIQNYKKLGIEFECENDIVKVFQKRLLNGYILNQKQLIERAKEVFPNEKIQPNVFSLNVSEITTEWIQERMREFGIKRNDLAKQIALDKFYINKLFSDEKPHLSKETKALFYYYFLTYELNYNFRN